jgi:hypothetical protein
METKPKSLFLNSLNYGLILGVVLIVVSLLYYILDVNLFAPLMAIVNLVVTLAIVIIVMLLGTNAYRDKFLGGKIAFSQCFLSGLIIGLVAFILSTIYSFIFMNYIEPGYVEEATQKLIDTYSSQLTEEQIDDMIGKIEKRMTPGRQIRTSAISGVIISVIISLIVSLFVKKEKYPGEGNV